MAVRASRALTADYNAEMIEQIARFPALRDRSVFVGNPDDVVPHGFGDGLPAIRDWVQQNYRFSGYVSGFEPDTLRRPRRHSRRTRLPARRAGLRGHRRWLRRRHAPAPPRGRGVPGGQGAGAGLRLVVVTGPRIEPDSLTPLPAADGLEVRGYVPDLYRTWQRAT